MLQAQQSWIRTLWPNGLERVKEWLENPPSLLIMFKLSFRSLIPFMSRIENVLFDELYLKQNSVRIFHILVMIERIQAMRNIPIQPFSPSLIFFYSPLLLSFQFGYCVIVIVSAVSFGALVDLLSSTMTEGMTTRYKALEDSISKIADQLQSQNAIISKFDTVMSIVQQHSESIAQNFFVCEGILKSISTQQTIMTDMMHKLSRLEKQPTPPLLPTPTIP